MALNVYIMNNNNDKISWDFVINGPKCYSFGYEWH